MQIKPHKKHIIWAMPLIIVYCVCQRFVSIAVWMTLSSMLLCVVCCRVLKILEYCVVNEAYLGDKAKPGMSSHDSRPQIWFLPRYTGKRCYWLLKQYDFFVVKSILKHILHESKPLYADHTFSLGIVGMQARLHFPANSTCFSFVCTFQELHDTC